MCISFVVVFQVRVKCMGKKAFRMTESINEINLVAIASNCGTFADRNPSFFHQNKKSPNIVVINLLVKNLTLLSYVLD